MERFDESLERPFDRVLDEPYLKVLGSLGLYDASLDLDSTPNPGEAEQRWAENPCIIPGDA